MHDLNKSELENVCREFVIACQGVLSWKGKSKGSSLHLTIRGEHSSGPTAGTIGGAPRSSKALLSKGTGHL